MRVFENRALRKTFGLK